jgi:hypothetical protein
MTIRVIEGTLEAIGQSTFNMHEKYYSYLKFRDKNENPVIIQDVNVGNIVDSYLKVGGRGRFCFITTRLRSHNGSLSALYGIALDGGDVAESIDGWLARLNGLKTKRALLITMGILTSFLMFGLYLLAKARQINPGQVPSKYELQKAMGMGEP